jgi:hypothetical protein
LNEAGSNSIKRLAATAAQRRNPVMKHRPSPRSVVSKYFSTVVAISSIHHQLSETFHYSL